MLWSTPLLAQSVSSDRPDFTDGTATVAPGALQIETGLTYGLDGPTMNTPQLLLRTGLSDSLEARVMAPDAIIVDGKATAGSAIFGAKYVVTISDGFTVGALPSVSAPVSGTAMDAEGLGVGVSLLWAWDVQDGWGLSGNLGTGLSGMMSDAGGTESQHFVTVSSGVPLSERLSLFVEAYAVIADDTTWFTDAGILYLASPKLQLDFSAGMPFQEACSGWFSAGLAVLL